MSEVKIISPSYKRAGRVEAVNVFLDKLIIAVHECEVAEYKKEYPNNEIMVLPNSTMGNMAKVRNYIRDNCGTRYLVMVDDDVKEFGYYEGSKRYSIGIIRLMELIGTGFQMCEDVGTILWGINLTDARRVYREYSPFSFLTPVLGPFSCHIVSDTNVIRYDERLTLNEDYDFALQVLHKYHKILRFNKYYYVAEHLTESGGCGAYRLMSEEKRQAEIMTKKWGKKVVKYNFAKTTNPKIHVPLKGI